MKRAYKYRLYPNKTQQAMLRQTFGCCRYVYDSTYNKLLTAKGVFLGERSRMEIMRHLCILWVVLILLLLFLSASLTQEFGLF